MRIIAAKLRNGEQRQWAMQSLPSYRLDAARCEFRRLLGRRGRDG